MLFCIEAGREVDEDERAFMASMDAARADRRPHQVRPPRWTPDAADADPVVPTATVSAATGAGIPELRRALLGQAFGGILGEPGEAPLVTRERHARALRAARDEVALFLGAMDDAVPMEFAATHLRAAVGALEDLVGVVSVDDVLDRVFGTFCVGK